MKDREIRLILVESDSEELLKLNRALCNSSEWSFQLEAFDMFSGVKRLVKGEVDAVIIDIDSGFGREAVEVFSKVSGLPCIVLASSCNDEPSEKEGRLYKNCIELGILEKTIVDAVKKYKEKKNWEKTLQLTQFSVDNSGDLFFFLHEDNTFLYVNQATCSVLGYSKDELLSKKMSDIAPYFDDKAYHEGNKENTSYTFESIYKTKSGKTLPVELTMRRLNYKGENYLSIFARDITGHKEIKENLNTLAKERNFESAIVNTASALVVVLDQHGHILRFNKACEQITGYSFEEVKGKVIWDKFLSLEEIIAFKKTLKNLEKGNLTSRFKNHWVTKGGTRKLITWSNTILLNKDGLVEYVVCTGIDITERKQIEKTIEHFAYYDVITGLPNRLLFTERLTYELKNVGRNAENLAVLFIGLDRFKRINNRFGHAAGDKILYSVAERLKKCVRNGDTVARLEGDIFAILLPGVKKLEPLKEFAERAFQTLKTAFKINERKVYMGVGIGIATYPDNGKDAEGLMRNSYTAMLQAKQKGKNKYQIYKPDLAVKGFELIELESEIREGIEQEEFKVYYQPQVELKTGRMVGMEALVRWHHPKVGLLRPGKFIPVAEESELIIPIGEHVMRTACKQNMEWQNKGYPPVRIAVNLSERQFRNQNMVELVLSILEETGLDPRWLELEITESEVIKNIDIAVTSLRTLSELGVNISLDDFGTGYSSLQYLKHLPVNTIKIDYAFVRDVTSNQDDANIVKAIIAMSHSLNLKVIAEGVETRQQLEFLRELECEEVQGYLFSRAVMASKATELIIENNKLSSLHSVN